MTETCEKHKVERCLTCFAPLSPIDEGAVERICDDCGKGYTTKDGHACGAAAPACQHDPKSWYAGNRCSECDAAAPSGQGLRDTLQEIAEFAVGHGDVCEIIAKRARAALAAHPDAPDIAEPLFQAANTAVLNLVTRMNLAEHPKSCECYGCKLSDAVTTFALARAKENVRPIVEREKAFERPSAELMSMRLDAPEATPAQRTREQVIEALEDYAARMRRDAKECDRHLGACFCGPQLNAYAQAMESHAERLRALSAEGKR